MPDQETGKGSQSQDTTLVVRRIIQATPERLFKAWTDPEQLKKWWGPQSVTCVDAEVDLRVGGRYRIANQFPDGKLLWISGEFQLIEPPHKLAYTWRIGRNRGHRCPRAHPEQDRSRRARTGLVRLPRRPRKISWLSCNRDSLHAANHAKKSSHRVARQRGRRWPQFRSTFG